MSLRDIVLEAMVVCITRIIMNLKAVSTIFSVIPILQMAWDVTDMNMLSRTSGGIRFVTDLRMLLSACALPVQVNRGRI